MSTATTNVGSGLANQYITDERDTPDLTTDPAFIALKRHFLHAIRAESMKAFEDQDR